MGQTVSQVEAAAKKGNADDLKVTNDALASLQDLASLQVQLFQSKVRDPSDQLRIPIDKMIVEDMVIKCKVSTDGDALAGEVKKTYSAFASGNIADGIGNVLSIGLKALFGNSAGSAETDTKYFIAVGEMGYPLRIDMLMYSYSFQSERLISTAQNVVAIALIVSSIQFEKVDEATLGATVQYCYGTLKPEEQNKILAKLLEVRKKAIDDKKKGYKRNVSYEDKVRQDVIAAWAAIRDQAGAVSMPPSLPWMAQGPKPINGIVMGNETILRRDRIVGPRVVEIA